METPPARDKNLDASSLVVVIDVPASKLSKPLHWEGHLTSDGRLLFETMWWRSGEYECCC